MDDKKKILIQHKKIVNDLKEHNNFYFINDEPKISDSEYDKIKRKALELEEKYPYLKKISESISGIIGAKPSNQFKKIKHLVPMLSLSNAFDIPDASVSGLS